MAENYLRDRERLIADIIERGDKCCACDAPLSHSDRVPSTASSLRPIATAIVQSRGALTNPRTLRKNYIRCAIACSEVCALRAIAQNAGWLEMDEAVRLAASGRAPSDKCEIATFSTPTTNDFIDNIVISEIIARLDVLILQMRFAINVAAALSAIRSAIHSYFFERDTDHYEMIEFANPCEGDDAALFEKCIGVIAVRGLSNQPVQMTIFEEAIATQIPAHYNAGYKTPVGISRAGCKRAVRITPGAAPRPGALRIAFPVQITPSESKKIVVSISGARDAHYELID